MSTFLIRSATSQSSSYPIVLMGLGGPRSRSNPHLKFVEVPGIEPATSWSVVTCWPLDQRGGLIAVILEIKAITARETYCNVAVILQCSGWSHKSSAESLYGTRGCYSTRIHTIQFLSTELLFEIVFKFQMSFLICWNLKEILYDELIIIGR